LVVNIRGVAGPTRPVDLAHIAEAISDIAERFSSDPESRAYLATHTPRYMTLLNLISKRVSVDGPLRILDVGPSYETEAIRRLWPECQVDSLGFQDARLLPPRPAEQHFEFDLVNAGDETGWPVAEPYAVILLAEVVEHLYTSPRLTLTMLASLLRDDGLLIVQTPNAAALSRRFWLLAGRNPFEPIRDDLHQAGHFREYTVNELAALCRQAGLTPTRIDLENYFRTGSRKNAVLLATGRMVPARLRQGITLQARKTPLG
jgi:trans-aconitate methyltransferase